MSEDWSIVWIIGMFLVGVALGYGWGKDKSYTIEIYQGLEEE